MLLVTQGARVLDPAGRELPSVPVRSDAIESLLAGDVWEAGFVRELRPAEASHKQLRLRLCSEKRSDNGRDLLRLISEATRRADAIPWLERLYIAFPSVTSRVVAVHDFLDAQERKAGGDKKLAFFMGLRQPRRGRPLNWSVELRLVCWLNMLADDGMSAAQAAAMLKDTWPEAKDIGDSRSLENLRSKYREHARIFAEGYYIPARSLRPAPWGGIRRCWRMFPMQ